MTAKPATTKGTGVRAEMTIVEVGECLRLTIKRDGADKATHTASAAEIAGFIMGYMGYEDWL